MKHKYWRYALWSSTDRNPGLLILRIFLGAAMIYHGYGKLFGGLDAWKQYGDVMSKIGIDFMPAFWGFMAGFAEFVGGICVILGLFTTIFSFLILCVMAVAAFVYHADDGYARQEKALAFLFIALLYVMKGAGRWSLDYYLFGRKKSS